MVAYCYAKLGCIHAIESLKPYFARFPFNLFEGTGIYPSTDPWGVPFDHGYYPERKALAGTRIAGPWACAFDGVQADMDWMASAFQLKRSLTLFYKFGTVCIPLRKLQAQRMLLQLRSRGMV